MHSELLANSDNKYDLVLQVARRAKLIKDDIQRDGNIEVNKPIPIAIHQMVDELKDSEQQ